MVFAFKFDLGNAFDLYVALLRNNNQPWSQSINSLNFLIILKIAQTLPFNLQKLFSIIGHFFLYGCCNFLHLKPFLLLFF